VAVMGGELVDLAEASRRGHVLVPAAASSAKRARTSSLSTAHLLLSVGAIASGGREGFGGGGGKEGF
jgi:hypothetical protein